MHLRVLMWGNPPSTTSTRLSLASPITISQLLFIPFSQQDKGKGAQIPWARSAPQKYHPHDIAPQTISHLSTAKVIHVAARRPISLRRAPLEECFPCVPQNIFSVHLPYFPSAIAANRLVSSHPLEEVTLTRRHQTIGIPTMEGGRRRSKGKRSRQVDSDNDEEWIPYRNTWGGSTLGVWVSSVRMYELILGRDDDDDDSKVGGGAGRWWGYTNPVYVCANCSQLSQIVLNGLCRGRGILIGWGKG